MIRTPVFWLLYGMITIGAVPGLLMLGQLKPMAMDFGLDDVPVTILGVTLAALPFALILDRITGGLTRPIFGWISDHIGREPGIALAFWMEGVALLALYVWRDVPDHVRADVRASVFRLGSDFQPVPGRELRPVRPPLRHHELRLALHRQGRSPPLVVDLLNRLQESTESWLTVFVVMIAFDWLVGTPRAVRAATAAPPHRRDRGEGTGASPGGGGATEDGLSRNQPGEPRA